jgi:hypothetical protein
MNTPHAGARRRATVSRATVGRAAAHETETAATHPATQSSPRSRKLDGFKPSSFAFAGVGVG